MSSSVPLAVPQAADPCPCGSGQTFADCCGAIISGKRKAATAEQLMRSRFTAHVINDGAYLHRTYLPTSKKPYSDDGQSASIGWTKLVIHSHEPGPKPDLAFVDFSAFFLDEQKNERVLQEKSEFQRLNGEWIFTRTMREGPAPHQHTRPKVGRNDPCPCGSGKKYKQCCLGKE